MLIDKQQIRRRFQQAAATYDRQATIQQRVADRLLALLAESGCTTPEKVLEIGCCTGLLTRRLLAQCPSIRTLVLNDLVESFRETVLQRCGNTGAGIRFLAGDIETLDLDGHYDLIISSSTFHWFHDLEATLARLARHLQPEGFLAFSMYGPENLREIRKLTGLGLDYPDLATLGTTVARHFTVTIRQERLETMGFADADAMLRHLRETGVNALVRTTWSRTRLTLFKKDYEQRFADHRGVRLTYHPMYVLARSRQAGRRPRP
ncbi:malonyl-ACP O-methyltransferase BioC [Thermodesulfobacteriota bacterium B35]